MEIYFEIMIMEFLLTMQTKDVKDYKIDALWGVCTVRCGDIIIKMCTENRSVCRYMYVRVYGWNRLPMHVRVHTNIVMA